MGEFYNTKETLWGGVGWEFLASGKTFLQSFRFDKQRFSKIFGYNPPNILNVKDKESVYRQLEFCIKNPEKLTELGAENKKWFENNIGNSLATKWVRLLENLH